MAHLAHLAQNLSAALSAVVFNLLDHKTLRKIINYINPNSYRVDGGKIEPVGKIDHFGGNVLTTLWGKLTSTELLLKHLKMVS